MAGELGGLLVQKAVMLYAIEVNPDENPGLTEANAVEISDPEYTTDLSVLERKFTSNDLSPFEDAPGRIIAGFQFTVEARSNGRAQSGLLADRPILADLIRSCGYELYAMTTSGVDCHSPFVADFDNSKEAPTVQFTSTVTPTSVTAPVLYTIEVQTGGASGAAKFIVHSNSKLEDATMGDHIAVPAPTAVITSGVTPILLGAKGGSITATWAGALVVGQKWQVACFPRGVKAKPVSAGFKTGHMSINMDGLLCRGGNGLGTFSISAKAGETAKFTFNHTTSFIDPEDELLPDVDFFNLPLAPQVELSTFTWGGNRNLMVDEWTFDQANDITPRTSVNHSKGYAGSRLTGRKPKMGFNPEATLEAEHPFWREYTRSKSKTWLTRIGTEVGNQICMFGGKSQTNDNSFGDRDGTTTYDKSANLKRIFGNDEMIFVFC